MGECAQFSVQGVCLFVDGPGLEEASSGGVKASANNVSLIPFDGVSGGMRVHAQLGLRCCARGRPPGQPTPRPWPRTPILTDTPSNGMRLTLLALVLTPPDNASSGAEHSSRSQAP